MRNGGNRNYTVNNVVVRLCGQGMAFQNIRSSVPIVAAGSQV